MKHAYLILAHNQFDLLQILISSIDDIRNDIYIHIDEKIKDIPKLKSKYSNIIFIDERIDVNWGDLSVIKAEYLLMEEAFNSKEFYRYFHLLSGVDLPLRNQDTIHEFFRYYDGKEFIGINNSPNLKKELNRKVNKIHIFSSSFRGSGLIYNLKRITRALFIKLQELVGYRRYGNRIFKKGTQWFSITNNLVSHVISRKSEVMKLYRNTFCPDEIFLQTIAWDGHFIERLYNIEDEGRGCMREIGWNNGKLISYTINDIDRLINSDKLFARKFNNKDMDIILKVIESLDLNGYK